MHMYLRIIDTLKTENIKFKKHCPIDGSNVLRLDATFVSAGCLARVHY